MSRVWTAVTIATIVLLSSACSGPASSSSAPSTPTAEAFVVEATAPLDVVELDDAVLRSADDALTRMREYELQPEVEGQPVRVIGIRLSTLGDALERENWAMTDLERTTRNPNTPVWEVEIDGFIYQHSCPIGATQCYWNHLIFMFDALDGAAIGMRYPDGAVEP